MSFDTKIGQMAIVLEPGLWSAVAATISGVFAVIAASASKAERRKRKRNRRPKTQARQPRAAVVVPQHLENIGDTEVKTKKGLLVRHATRADNPKATKVQLEMKLL
jgi:hypothetical protein